MRRAPPEAVLLPDLLVVNHLFMIQRVVVAPPGPVDAIAQQADERRNQGQNRPDRHDHRQNRAEPKTAEDRVRHQEEPDQREHHRQSGEDHGLGRGTAGNFDRFELAPAVPPLFSVPLDHEERVVDTDRQTDH